MADVTEEVPYQSLYRRFRPSTFAEVRGQDHVVLALRNAVRDGRVAHAYLFSGPRGTGKTSTARILAKALNCTDLHDGEPCGVCPSCVEITRGTSLDVHELDAASNNGVDAMRDLVSRAALGSPGRQKVYIVDEVHMLSTAASNALLKTLEEPPPHVIFVLATTDPQKVLPTIRSRTQHFEFRLLGPDTLSELLAQVRTDAHLDVGDDALDLAVRRGRGSARDALSILDQVAASDAVDDDLPELDEVVEALAERDVERALVAVAHLTAAGFSPQQLTVDLVDHLRQGFLALVAPELVTVAGAERDVLAAQAGRVGLATLVRAMEDLGRAQVGMRDAPDPRVNLEVALVRLVHPEADDSPAALLARIERLEASTVAGTGDAPRAASAPTPTSTSATTPST
ncbi:MAG TPA: DNA polymerase III subunit gamma/tau, partial [Acidimicrobiales bacterium]